jgi:hypothetical protein
VDKCRERDRERRGATQKEERKLDWNKKIQLLGYSNVACKVGVTADGITRVTVSMRELLPHISREIPRKISLEIREMGENESNTNFNGETKIMASRQNISFIQDRKWAYRKRHVP